MNEIISTSDRLFMVVCGLSWCGKTNLISITLLLSIFSLVLNQNDFSAQLAQISLIREETEQSSSNFWVLNYLLVFYKLNEEIFSNNEFSKLSTA